MSLTGIDVMPSPRPEEAAKADSPARLIVVSNRLPLTLRRGSEGWRAERSTGGLATALGPVMARAGGLWIGWPGDSPESQDENREQVLTRWGGATASPPSTSVRPSPSASTRATRTRPCGRSSTSSLRGSSRSGDWDAYVRANERFRDTVLEHFQPGDSGLDPRLPSDAAPGSPPGSCAGRQDRASSCTSRSRRPTCSGCSHDARSCCRVCSAPTRSPSTPTDTCSTSGTPCCASSVWGAAWTASIRGAGSCRSRPTRSASRRGVPPTWPNDDRHVHGRIADLRQRFAGRRVLLAVDRLDYTKGIPERLRTFRQPARPGSGTARDRSCWSRSPSRRGRRSRSYSQLRQRGERAGRGYQRRLRARAAGRRSSSSAEPSRGRSSSRSTRAPTWRG